jgi:putative oxidoreductase
MAELRLSYLEQRADRTEVLKKWLLRSIVAISFIYIGKGKFDPHSQWVELFARLGFGQWLRYFTGVLQVGGGLLVLIPRTVAIGFCMLAVTMLGAMAAWIFFLGAPLAALIPGTILGALIFVGGEDVLELESWCQQHLLKSKRDL